MRYLPCLLFFLVLSSCSSSLDDYRDEGETLTQKLISHLNPIQSRAELLEAAPKLTKLFDQLVNVMIAAQELKKKHPELETIDLTPQNQQLSEALRQELNRIYQIDGGKEIIEKCQEEALNRLDAYHQKRKKQQG